MLLDVQGLTAGYGAGTVLHGVDLQVDDGEVAVVLGANGAGKTTTMRCLAGLLKPSSGAMTFDGKPHARTPDSIVQSGISLVPQGRGTFSGLSVLDNLRVGASTRTDDEIDSDIDRWFSTFPVLGERREQAAGTLSGGEQQMLAIARALMSRPRLLLCDEPSLGLAPIIVKEVFDILATLNRETGTALLIVEQNAQLALELADRVFLLEVGHVIASGDAAEFRDNDTVRRSYLGY